MQMSLELYSKTITLSHSVLSCAPVSLFVTNLIRVPPPPFAVLASICCFPWYQMLTTTLGKQGMQAVICYTDIYMSSRT